MNYLLALINPIRTRLNWKKDEKRFIDFLSKVKIEDNRSVSKEVLIVIQPWALTPLPWYLISLAIAFHYFGRSVRIIFDDLGYGMHGWAESLQQDSINRVLKKLPSVIKWEKLSDFSVRTEDDLHSLNFRKLVNKNKTIHYRGENYPESSKGFSVKVADALRKSAQHINTACKMISPAYIVTGGGGYRSSGVWIDIAEMHGLRVATMDSGFSILLLSTEGIAANLEDIPRAFNLLPPEDTDWIISQAKEELEKRMHGKDQFTSQSTPLKGEKFSYGIILPLNQSYDLSALERHTVFSSQTEWMLETIKWVLQNTSEKIAIRRHPVERNPIYLSNDDYEKSIAMRFGKNDRIRFIPSDEDVNTYDLMHNAKVVVPYISTVGVEAAALGKPVITEGSSCYADLGFVWSARDKDEYFQFLSQAINNELEVTEQQRIEAWKCYYLTQCCNWHHTTFTPQPIDFEKWVQENPNDLLIKTEVVEVLEAMDNNIPISITNHKKLQLVTARN